MSLFNELSFKSSKLSHSYKICSALESSLQQCLLNFRDLTLEWEQVCIESDAYKEELLKQKEKCESKSCSSAEALKLIIADKDKVIQLVASTLMKLNETKNIAILTEAFKILGKDIPTLTSPKHIKESNNCENKPEERKHTPKDNKIESINTPIRPKENKNESLNTPPFYPNVNTSETAKTPNHSKINKTKTATTPDISRVKRNLLSPKIEPPTFIEGKSLNDESVSEIESTPTGRKSPIIQSKKLRGSLVSSEQRAKKKAPEEWQTPEGKSIKLCYTISSSPRNGKMRQTRLTYTRTKSEDVVDLTSSPECSGGARFVGEKKCEVVKLLIKKESSDNDDTILPSPTSGPNFSLSKTSSKDKADKFKRPLSLKSKADKSSNTNLQTKDEKENCPSDIAEMEESINILQPKRLAKTPKKVEGIKMEPLDEDITVCDASASMSVLQNVNNINCHLGDNDPRSSNKTPTKRPLAENTNATNVPTQCDMESSMSLLQNNFKMDIHPVEGQIKKKTPEKVEPVYKEPTVRTKAEKRALPAWCCVECQNFYGVLYKDDPEAIEKVIANCGKHRGRNNPARPKTPPGFWYPRWDVPENTEEFNKRNNAL